MPVNDAPAPSLDLSIVIPAYNEAHKIERDLREAHAFVTRRHLDAEIVLVDDGSRDETALAAYRLSREIPELRILSYVPNRGKGHAVRYGVLRARGKRILSVDAGLCVPYDLAIIGLEMLDLGMCDIAHGSRRMRGSIKKAQPLLRRVGSRGFSLLIHTAVGIPGYFSDTQCGFKLYRWDVAQKLFGELGSDGFMFDIELILRAVKANYVILEFPVLWTNDPDSRYNPLRGGAVDTLRQLAKIKLRLMGLQSPAPPRPVNERPLENSVSLREST